MGVQPYNQISTPSPKSQSEGNALLIIVIIISICLVIVLLLYKYRYELSQKLTSERSLSQMKDDACKEKKRVFKELGLDADCEKDACPSSKTPDSDNKCPIKGMVPFTTGKDVKCCKWGEGGSSSGNTSGAIVNTMWSLGEDILKESVIISLMKQEHGFLGKQFLKTSAGKAALASKRKLGEKMATKVAGRVTVRFAETVAKGMMIAAGGCAATGVVTAGIGCAVASAAGVLFTIGSLLSDVMDTAGYNQYMDQKEMLLLLRDSLEGRLINSLKSNDEARYPDHMVFNLISLKSLPNIDSLPEFKHINTVYTENYIKYKTSNLHKILEQLDTDTRKSLLDEYAKNETLPKVLEDAIDAFEENHHEERDRFIWEQMSNLPLNPFGIRGNNGTYIMYRPAMSGEIIPGVTLNSAGVNYYNIQAGKTIHSENSVSPLVYTKYYRDLLDGGVKDAGTGNQRYVLTQVAFKEEVPFVSVSYPVLKELCTKGYDEERIAKTYPINKFFGLPTPEIIPEKQLVSYDKDTGICHYDVSNRKWEHTGYCTYMGKNPETVKEKMPCKGGGCNRATYDKCIDEGFWSSARDLSGLFCESCIAAISRTSGKISNWIEDEGSGGALQWGKEAASYTLPGKIYNWVDDEGSGGAKHFAKKAGCSFVCCKRDCDWDPRPDCRDIGCP